MMLRLLMPRIQEKDLPMDRSKTLTQRTEISNEYKRRIIAALTESGISLHKELAGVSSHLNLAPREKFLMYLWIEVGLGVEQVAADVGTSVNNIKHLKESLLKNLEEQLPSFQRI